METTHFLGLLAEGAISAAIFLTVAFLLRRYTRIILAVGLIAAAVAYIFFVQRIESSLWLGVEIAGVAIYGVMALLGIRRSPWWLVAGWIFHPLWDIVLHFMGPGHTFAPVTYTVPCLSFDLLVAAIIAVGILRGWRHFAGQPVRKAAGQMALSQGNG